MDNYWFANREQLIGYNYDIKRFGVHETEHQQILRNMKELDKREGRC